MSQEPYTCPNCSRQNIRTEQAQETSRRDHALSQAMLKRAEEIRRELTLAKALLSMEQLEILKKLVEVSQ